MLLCFSRNQTDVLCIDKEELSQQKFPKRWPDNREPVIIRIDGTNLLLMIRKMRSSRPHFKYIFHYGGADKQHCWFHHQSPFHCLSFCIWTTVSLLHRAKCLTLVMLGLSQIESICFKAESWFSGPATALWYWGVLFCFKPLDTMSYSIS